MVVAPRERANSTEAIYGTIIVTAVVAAASEDPGASSIELLEATITTAFVFWLAHVYATTLGDRLASTAPMPQQVRRAARRDWPVVGAAIPACLALLLGVVGILSRANAVGLAIVFGFANLFGWGVAYGRELGLRLPGTLATGVLSGLLGLFVIALKALVV